MIPKDRVDPAVELLQDVFGDLSSPATGIVFILPVERVVGLAPELGDESRPI